MLVMGPEMAAHWVTGVFPERRASMLEESVLHRVDTLADIAGTAQRTSHLVYIIDGTRIVET